MYEQTFGLSRRPFAASPDADCYFPATPIETARQTLFRCIDRGEGAALLVGPSGTGKSLLLQVLAEQFRQRFELALLGSGRLTSLRELLQAILYELNLPYRDREEGDLRLALIDHLSDSRRAPEAAAERDGLLLLIDEAHTLPLKVLEEIRLITNLIRGGQPKVRLVLAGSSALEERFASPKLDAFNQRVSARCYLQAFDRGETHEYIRAQIEWAAGQPEQLFNPEALDAVYQATGGVPRLINQVCDHALVLACGAGALTLDRPAIERAWSDLQQLPTPANRESCDDAQQQGADVIEFGLLDDEPSGEDNAAENEPFELSVNDGGADEDACNIESIEIDMSDEIDLAEDPSIEINDDSSALECELQTPDPLRRLTQVEDQIAAIDGDFEPAVAFGPQIDLSFEAIDPFGETFAEEELVIDPFAMASTDALANRPVVQSAEGRKLGALLRPFPEVATPRLSLALTEELDEFELNGDNALSRAKLPGDAPASAIAPFDEERATPAITFWTPDEGVLENERVLAAPYASYTLLADRPRPIHPIGTTSGAATDGEPALIVIEDEPQSAHQVTVVRRGQYRRLFSSLRRG